MSTNSRFIKKALIHDTDGPPGTRGPMHLECVCGRQVPVPHPFTADEDVACKCGVRYDSHGWIVLSAFTVSLEGGHSYVTNMAKGTTLTDARNYLLGAPLEQPDGSTTRVVAVENAE